MSVRWLNTKLSRISKTSRGDGRRETGGEEQVSSLKPPASSLKLKDIATIQYDTGERWWHREVDGKPTVMIGVFKESGANIVAVTEAVRKKWDEDLSKRPGMRGVHLQILFDQGHYIKDSINNLKTTGLWGGLFAVIVLFFFLRRARLTLIITLAIPISLLITMTFVYFIGWSRKNTLP